MLGARRVIALGSTPVVTLCERKLLEKNKAEELEHGVDSAPHFAPFSMYYTTRWPVTALNCFRRPCSRVIYPRTKNNAIRSRDKIGSARRGCDFQLTRSLSFFLSPRRLIGLRYATTEPLAARQDARPKEATSNRIPPLEGSNAKTNKRKERGGKEKHHHGLSLCINGRRVLLCAASASAIDLEESSRAAD